MTKHSTLWEFKSFSLDPFSYLISFISFHPLPLTFFPSLFCIFQYWNVSCLFYLSLFKSTCLSGVSISENFHTYLYKKNLIAVTAQLVLLNFWTFWSSKVTLLNRFWHTQQRINLHKQTKVTVLQSSHLQLLQIEYFKLKMVKQFVKIFLQASFI